MSGFAGGGSRPKRFRTQAEVFSSADATDTMKTVAETWDLMTEDLEGTVSLRMVVR